MATWDRHLWWLMFAVILLIVWKFDPMTKRCIDLFNKTPVFNALSPKSQTKVQLKTMRVICFSTSFVIALSGLLAIWTQGTFYVEELPYWTDKALKYGLVAVSSVYCLDIVYYRQHLAWYNWLHHSMSLLVFVCVFDYNISFIVSRIYCCILGMLLTSRWILHFASLYYYLGNEDHTEVRIVLYLCGLVVHAIFTFGQLFVGLIFKIKHNRMNTGRLIFWIAFEIAVLPSQLHTFYDIYCIIKIKIYNTAFSAKIHKFSMADPIKNNRDLRNVRSQTIRSESGDSSAGEAEIMEISDDEQGFSLPADDVCVNQLGCVHGANNSVTLTEDLATDQILIDQPPLIQTFDGFSYTTSYGLDVRIDDGTNAVCLFGKIHCSKIQALNGFFKGNIAQIDMQEAYPVEDVVMERYMKCNDMKYKVTITITTNGMITATSSIDVDNAVVIDDPQANKGVLKLDGITYETNTQKTLDHGVETGWD